MNLATIKNVVTWKLSRQVLIARKHSPVFLFGAGVVGVVGAAILASRATLKLDEVIAEANEDLSKARSLEHADYTEEDRTRDVVIIYARTGLKIAQIYAPAVLVGVASIAALTGSHVMLTRRNVALAAAYAAIENGFRQYRARVVKEFGYEKDREFRYDMEDRTIVVETDEGPVSKTIKQAGPNGASVYARFFDEASVNWSKTPSYNQMFLQCQQNYANDLLRSRGHVFLNEVYDMLDLPRSKEGAIVGWIVSDCGETEYGDGYIDFGVFEGDRHSGMRFVLGHTPSILLDFNVDGIIFDKI